MNKKTCEQTCSGMLGEKHHEDCPTFICEHCKIDTRIRNLSGFCDHLYYPKNCKECQFLIEGIEPRIRKDFESADVRYEGNALKAFILGAIFGKQMYRNVNTKKEVDWEVQETLEKIVDLADKFFKI